MDKEQIIELVDNVFEGHKLRIDKENERYEKELSELEREVGYNKLLGNIERIEYLKDKINKTEKDIESTLHKIFGGMLEGSKERIVSIDKKYTLREGGIYIYRTHGRYADLIDVRDIEQIKSMEDEVANKEMFNSIVDIIERDIIGYREAADGTAYSRYWKPMTNRISIDIYNSDKLKDVEINNYTTLKGFRNIEYVYRERSELLIGYKKSRTYTLSLSKYQFKELGDSKKYLVMMIIDDLIRITDMIKNRYVEVYKHVEGIKSEILNVGSKVLALDYL